MKTNTNSKYVIEIILFLTYALFAMSWKAGDFLIAKSGFELTDVALMTNAINFAKIIGSLSAAAVLAKLGYRNMYNMATALIVSGVLLTMIQGFSPVFMIRFVLGLGGALVLVTINPVVAKLFSGEELTVVNGLNAVAFNVGLAVVLAMSGMISNNVDLTIQLISGSLVVAIIFWNMLIGCIEDAADNKEAAAQEVREQEAYGMLDGLKEKFNWVFALSYSGLLSFYLVAFTFMDPQNVKYVIFAGVVGALAGTFKAKSFKNKLQLVRLSAFLQVLSAIGFLFFYDSAWAKLLGTLLGFLIFFPMPAYVTLAFLRKDSTPRKISIAFSIFWAVSYAVSIFAVQAFAAIKISMGTPIAFLFIIAMESSFFFGPMLFMRDDQ